MFLREMFSRSQLPRPVLDEDGVGEYELKYWIPAAQSPAVGQWMTQTLRPHTAHPRGTICSIYFDTDDLRALEEKEASFYGKTKYRIRWYADAAGRPLDGPAWLERKEKVGSRRRKQRHRLAVPVDALAAWPLESPQWRSLLQEHVPAGDPLAGSLRPVLELRYHRSRYVHPVTGDGFCLDSQIRCVRTHTAFFPTAGHRDLRFSVLEQKGASPDPLPILRPLPRFGARRAALSKYHLVALATLDLPDLA